MEQITLVEDGLRVLFTQGAADVSIAQAVEAFLRTEGPAWSGATLKWYRARLGRLAGYLGEGRALADLQEVDLTEWREALQVRQQAYGSGESTRKAVERTLSKPTIKGHVRAAKRFFRWLHQWGVLTVDLGAKLKGPRLPNYLRKGVGEFTAKTVIAAARDNPRDFALIRFMDTTGARRAGVAGLKLSDLNLDSDDPARRRRATVREKFDQEREVLMTPNALKALLDWLAVRPETDDEHVFLGKQPGRPYRGLTPDGVSKILQRYKENLRLPGRASPHQWRHRFFRKRLEEGMPLNQLAQLGGHKDPAITIRYYGGLAIDEIQESYDRRVKDTE